MKSISLPVQDIFAENLGRLREASAILQPEPEWKDKLESDMQLLTKLVN